MWFKTVVTREGPGRLRVERAAFHPLLGHVSCGEGVVDDSTSQLISGNLSQGMLDRYYQAICNWLNEYGPSPRISPLHILILINFTNQYYEKLRSDFSWAAVHLQDGPAEPVELDFNNFLAPRDRLRILDWRVHSANG